MTRSPLAEARREFAAEVTSPPAGEVNTAQIIELDRPRRESMFDQLKPRWRLEGFCSRMCHASSLAARLATAVLQRVAVISATAGTGTAGGERGREAVVAADGAPPGRERAEETPPGDCQRKAGEQLGLATGGCARAWRHFGRG